MRTLSTVAKSKMGQWSKIHFWLCSDFSLPTCKSNLFSQLLVTYSSLGGRNTSLSHCVIQSFNFGSSNCVKRIYTSISQAVLEKSHFAFENFSDISNLRKYTLWGSVYFLTFMLSTFLFNPFSSLSNLLKEKDNPEDN